MQSKPDLCVTYIIKMRLVMQKLFTNEAKPQNKPVEQF